MQLASTSIQLFQPLRKTWLQIVSLSFVYGFGPKWDQSGLSTNLTAGTSKAIHERQGYKIVAMTCEEAELAESKLMQVALTSDMNNTKYYSATGDKVNIYANQSICAIMLKYIHYACILFFTTPMHV